MSVLVPPSDFIVQSTYDVERPSSKKLAVSEAQLVRSLTRASFFDFVKEFWDVVIPEKPHYNWHIPFLCDELQIACERIFRGEPKEYDVATNIPPGTTKSTLQSVMLPAWAWTRMPSFAYIGASHGENLQLDFATKTRDIIRSPKYQQCFPEIRIRKDVDAKFYFKNTAGGFRYGVGTEGGILGMHAHFIGVDDPIDPKATKSDLELKAVNYWIDHELSSRKKDKLITVMSLVMQRLHQEDPTALFLRRKAIRHICLPAESCDIVLPESLRAHYVSGLLDPRRLSLKVLEEEQQKGTMYYSAQFRQQPTPPGGAIFKVDKLKVGIPPSMRKFRRLCRFWDKAGTLDGGDWTVGVLLGLDNEGRFWILDVRRFQLDSYEREKLIKDTALEDGSKVIVGLEKSGGEGGKESAQGTVRRLYKFRTKVRNADKSTGGKAKRADQFSAQVNAGNVYLPEDQRDGKQWVGWAEGLVEELRYFPVGRHDDRVDAGAGAYNIVAELRRQFGGIHHRESEPEIP